MFQGASAQFPDITVSRDTTSLTLSWFGSNSHGITSNFTVNVIGRPSLGPYPASDLDSDGSVTIPALDSGVLYNITILAVDTDDLLESIEDRTRMSYKFVCYIMYGIMLSFSVTCISVLMPSILV